MSDMSSIATISAAPTTTYDGSAPLFSPNSLIPQGPSDSVTTSLYIYPTVLILISVFIILWVLRVCARRRAYRRSVAASPTGTATRTSGRSLPPVPRPVLYDVYIHDKGGILNWSAFAPLSVTLLRSEPPSDVGIAENTRLIRATLVKMPLRPSSTSEELVEREPSDASRWEQELPELTFGTEEIRWSDDRRLVGGRAGALDLV